MRLKHENSISVAQDEAFRWQTKAFESPHFLIHDRREFLKDHVRAGRTTNEQLILVLGRNKAQAVNDSLIR